MVKPYESAAEMSFNLVGVTDKQEVVSGSVTIHLFDKAGQDWWNQRIEVDIRPNENRYFPLTLSLPEQVGGYTLVAEFRSDLESAPVISRRYIKVGDAEEYSFYTPVMKTLESAED